MEVQIVALVMIGGVLAALVALIIAGKAKERREADQINQEKEEALARRREADLAIRVEQERKRALSNAAKGIPVTTALSIPGREIDSIINVVGAEAALGMNIFKDISTGFSDLVGGRGHALQEAFREAREICIAEMQMEAQRFGADAVIAVDLDYSHLSSNLVAGGMIFVAATGTAVKLAPQAPST